MIDVKQFPTTRYQGSKRKHLPWIAECLKDLQYNSVLDAFGGTGSVSLLFKRLGKEVHYNDYLPFNEHVGRALLLPSFPTEEEVRSLFIPDDKVAYDDVIQRRYRGIYYTEEENKELDIACQNILNVGDLQKASTLWYILIQAALCKRPFSLFHRANLSYRLASVDRTFGNKVTWDRSFQAHCEKFRKELNRTLNETEVEHKVLREDALNLEDVQADLLYVDPPYLPKKGSIVKYAEFYHFLNGMVQYHSWEPKILAHTKNMRVASDSSSWESESTSMEAFETLAEQHRGKSIVISYREDGVPSIADLQGILERAGKAVEIFHKDVQYAISKKKTKEVLIVGT